MYLLLILFTTLHTYVLIYFRGEKWHRWLLKLQAFFPVDDILPYTFLALLGVNNVIDFLQFNEPCRSQNDLPVDAVLGCARHYLFHYCEDWVSLCNLKSEI